MRWIVIRSPTIRAAFAVLDREVCSALKPHGYYKSFETQTCVIAVFVIGLHSVLVRKLVGALPAALRRTPSGAISTICTFFSPAACGPTYKGDSRYSDVFRLQRDTLTLSLALHT